MEFLLSDYLLLPQEPGIYFFLGKKNEVLYVGKAKNLKKRIASYFARREQIGPKTQLMLSQAVKIHIIPVQSEIEALLLEASNIKKYAPRYNVTMKDGKSYPLIKITKKEGYPKVLTVRRETDTNSLYFGPYPDVSSMRLVLKTIRRIFPYESVKHHKNKRCLYFHLGLCPCAEALNSGESRKDYKRTISYIIKILQGESKKVIKDLEKERNENVKKEEFEKANAIQKKIKAMDTITKPVKKPFEYNDNPNLITDLREKELIDLKNYLNNFGLSITNLERIECFDVSTIQGTNSTASMIVFINGEKNSSEYRRFKIKTIGSISKPNDFAMMEEVLSRRFNHNDWKLPDLIIVDGGKGQISSAKKILNEKRLSIPLIGLAKRYETIITSDFKEIVLPKSSPALQLIMRMRDEAHRFAITYHRKLRSKSFLK